MVIKLVSPLRFLRLQAQGPLLTVGEFEVAQSSPAFWLNGWPKEVRHLTRTDPT
jgi:hypothetical protein